MRGTTTAGSEVERLRRVYYDYAERGLGATKWSAANPGNQAIERERRHQTEQWLRRAGLLPLTDKRILDVGCGAGKALAEFEVWGAKPDHLFGVDLLPDRIRQAQEQFPALSFQPANAERLPFPNQSFDLVLAFTVFSSILEPQMARNVRGQIQRVLRRGGGVLWYDFCLNNPFNPQVRGISRRGVQRLFSRFDCCLESLTLLPPLARRLGFLTPWLYPALAAFPFLRTHYLGLLIKR